MKNLKFAFLLVIGSLFLPSALLAQESSSDDSDLPFLSKLQAQADREYNELIASIKNMSDDEYRAYLQTRVDKAYSENSQSKNGIVIVDVTDEVNQPEPNFLAKLFFDVPEKKDFGISKIKALLPALKSVDTESNLSFYQQYTSADQQRHFQHIDGSFDKSSALSLIAEEDIVDFHIAEEDNSAPARMTSIHNPTGRVLPRQVNKQYDSKFIRDGLYADVMKRFEVSDRVLILVGFKMPSTEDYSNFSHQDFGDWQAKVDSFLNKWTEFDFELFHQTTFSIYIVTSKAHVEAMRSDPLVDTIRTAKHFFQP